MKAENTIYKLLSRTRSWTRIGLLSSIFAGLLLVGFSIERALRSNGGHQIPLGAFGGVLACISVYYFLQMSGALVKNVRWSLGRTVVDAGTWSFEYPYVRTRLRDEQARLDREGGHLSLLLIEVPLLTDLRETAGSMQRERTARKVTRMLYAALPQSDITVRISEGMFLAFMPDTSPEEARLAGIRLWKGSRDFDPGCGPKANAGLKIKVGIAGYPENGENIDCAFAAAYEALSTAEHADDNSIAVSKQTFRSLEKGNSLLRQVRGEGLPPPTSPGL